jgi:EmrB/QacA subfamily drug resistance transporter
MADRRHRVSGEDDDPRPGLLAVLTSERPRPAAVRNWANGWWLAIGTVCLGAFMGQLDASIVTLTYPALRTEFHTTFAAVEWVSLSYLLTLVAGLIPVGRLSDARGRKLFYLYGFAVFTVASAACGLAPSLVTLVAFRVVQAIGAAMLQANSVALVRISAPHDRTRSALGVQAAAQALGLALGPTLGGVLVSTVGWRWVFDINIPVGVIAIVAGYYLLPRTRERTPVAAFDWAGLVLLAVATTSGLLGISAASGLHMPTAVIIGLVALSVLAGWGFVQRQRRAASPLVDLSVLRTRAIGAGLLAALSGYLVLFGPLVLIPVVLTRTGYSTSSTGLVLTALPAGFALAALLDNRVVPPNWTDHRRGVVGSVICVLALGVAIVLPLTTLTLVPELAVLGVGLGVFTPANNTTVMTAIPARVAGIGGGLVNMTRSLGTALGVALVTLAVQLTDDSATMAWVILLAAAAAMALTTRAARTR